MNKEMITAIYWEVVGDPEEDDYLYRQYLDMVSENMTEEEVRAIAEVVREIAEETPYEE